MLFVLIVNIMVLSGQLLWIYTGIVTINNVYTLHLLLSCKELTDSLHTEIYSFEIFWWLLLEKKISKTTLKTNYPKMNTKKKKSNMNSKEEGHM